MICVSIVINQNWWLRYWKWEKDKNDVNGTNPLDVLLGGDGLSHSSVTGGGIGVDTVVMETSPMIDSASFVAWYMRSNSSLFASSSADSSINKFYRKQQGMMGYMQLHCGMIQGVYAVALWGCVQWTRVSCNELKLLCYSIWVVFFK